jgi:hypothetical protein
MVIVTAVVVEYSDMRGLSFVLVSIANLFVTRNAILQRLIERFHEYSYASALPYHNYDAIAATDLS